jgi:hypothetical protein
MNTSFLLVKCEDSTKPDFKKRFFISFQFLNFLYQLPAFCSVLREPNFFKTPCRALPFNMQASGRKTINAPAGGSPFP